MTDKLKIFVRNRKQEFDSVEPPTDMWSKIDNNLTMKNTHWIKNKWISKFFYLGFSGTVIAILIYFASQKTGQISPSKNENQSNIILATKDTFQQQDQKIIESIKDEKQLVQKSSINNSVLISDTTKLDLDQKADIDLPEYTETIVFNNTNIVTQTKDDSTYVFPKLTDSEIKANNKQKKKMLDQLFKLNKTKYSLIPNENNHFAENFYMQSVEVTNLEYRTFLFDLLIQNKKDEFLIAKPIQSLWINSNGSHKFDNFKDGYFSDKKLNEYPVVNISLEGAKLYCEWFNELIKTNGNLKNENTQILTVRLPKESEWVFSAIGESKNAAYPWGTDSIQNSKKCFLANFCFQKLQEKFKQPYGYTTKTNISAYTTAGLVTNNDTMTTAMVYCYNRNNYGLYCMSGNVSEWVISEDSKTCKAIGGNWGSDFEHLKINSESEFKSKISASPFIGFRPIIIIKK